MFFLFSKTFSACKNNSFMELHFNHIFVCGAANKKRLQHCNKVSATLKICKHNIKEYAKSWSRGVCKSWSKLIMCWRILTATSTLLHTTLNIETCKNNSCNVKYLLLQHMSDLHYQHACNARLHLTYYNCITSTLVMLLHDGIMLVVR